MSPLLRAGLLIAQLLFLPLCAQAEGPKQIFEYDLAAPVQKHEEQVTPGTEFYLRWLNMIPDGNRYSIRENRIIQPAPALPKPAAVSAPIPTKFRAPDKVCPDLSDVFHQAQQTLATVSSETQVRDLYATASKQIDAAATCLSPSELATYRQQLDNLFAATRYQIGPRSLGPSENLTITLSRPDAGKEKNWEFIFKTPADGVWLASYALAILPNRDQEYYARDNGDGSFTVTRKGGDNGVKIVPAVFYSWYNPKQSGIGFSAGLGFDLANPILLLGANWNYHQNLSINVGVAVAKQKRLAGAYQDGEVLSASVTEDALVKEVYKPNLFLAVGFRFK